jgi:uncharacterized membrane protein YraQ (UPF0718 family)
MTPGKARQNMLAPTLVMGALALVLLFVGYQRGGGEHLTGLRTAVTLVGQILPLLFFAFIVGGMIQALLPQDLLNRWVGTESGLRGILLGTLAGGLCPGGPYVSLPLVAGLLRAGAGIGVLVAFLTSWSLWAIARLPMEVGILGWKVTAVRLACTFFFPPVAGLIAHVFFRTRF